MITYTRPAQGGVSKVSQYFLHVTLAELSGRRRSNKEAERKFGVGGVGERKEGRLCSRYYVSVYTIVKEKIENFSSLQTLLAYEKYLCMINRVEWTH